VAKKAEGKDVRKPEGKEVLEVPRKDSKGLSAEVIPELAKLSESELLAFAQQVVKGLDTGQLDRLEFEARALRAGSEFSLDGFRDFYWCLFGRKVPPMADAVWVPELFNAYKGQSGVMLECFRGATKSTMVLAWCLYITGHRPEGSTVIVRINDDAAAETGRGIDAIISVHPGWKACFPNIVPDKEAGWSSKGYYVMDNRVDYGEWKKKTITDHLGEPSVLVAGVTSGDIIGKHPSNGMYFDDLHNERNTRSEREMQSVVDILRSDIIPTWNRPEGKPVLAVACTPWSENDAYHAMLETGLFKRVTTPIMVPDETSQDMVNGQRIRSTWPQAYPAEKIQKIHDENPIQFARMYLCDLSAMKGIALKKEWLHDYPQEKINSSWPVYFGIDFASTEDKLKDKDRDFFTVAVGVGVPGGGVVITGGYRGQISTGEALQKVQAMAALYPTLVTVGVEKWGKGEEFKTKLLYETNLPILPLPLEGTTVVSKGKRFQEGLGAMFMMSRAWVSDVRDDFLNAFRDEWVGWDGGKSRTGHDDTLDAVYWCCLVARGHLMPIPSDRELPVRPKVKEKSIWASLGTAK